MNVADIVILILLLFGAIGGFKAGVIKKLADFLGMFIIVILAFYLKNDLSVIMYENLPFFSFGGFIKGIGAINILLYELIAFLIIFIALLFFYLHSGLIATLENDLQMRFINHPDTFQKSADGHFIELRHGELLCGNFG